MGSRGFSLLEFLITVCVMSVVLGVGIPGLHGFVLDARRTADINAFVRAVQLARSESAKAGIEVMICPSADTLSCSGTGSSFDLGWIVLRRRSASESNVEAFTELPLLAYQPRIAGSIRANRSSFTFRPNYRRGTNGTVIFCDARGAGSARAVIVSYTGRPRVSAALPDGQALQCAPA